MTDNQQLNTSSGQKTAAKQKTGLLSIITFLLVVVLFASIGAGGWIGYQHHQTLRDQLAGLALQQANSAQQDATQLSEIETLSAQIKAQLASNENRIAKLASSERQDWLLAEAEYLLRLANQRLNLEKDWQGSLAMLQAADKVLFETKNPIVDSIRLQIASEIQALRAVPAVDTTGAISRIQALASEIKSLPWAPTELPAKEVVIASEEQEKGALETFLQKSKDALFSIVRYSKRDEPLDAPLSPQQHYYLQQNLALMLEQAQVALVRQNPELYVASLERAEQWLGEFILLENAQVDGVQQTLVELKSWNVNPALPVINQSLVDLMDLISRQNRGVAAAERQAQPAK